MNPSEIQDEEINVEEIMQKIRDGIRKRKGYASTFQDLRETPEATSVYGPYAGTETTRDLDYINANWDIHNNSYFISSHRPIIGKYLIRGRELVHGEIRRYVDPMIYRQCEWNASAVRSINGMMNRFVCVESRTRDQEEAFQRMSARIQDQEDALQRVSSRVDEIADRTIPSISADLNRRLDSLNLDSLIWELHKSTLDGSWCANILKLTGDRSPSGTAISNQPHTQGDLGYLTFEKQFRGSRDDIKNRQLEFLNYFEGCHNVLDIGCGRGEFLEILKENGIAARGIDIDSDMVAACKSRGFDVEEIDAITYLDALEDSSLDGIFIDQVAEHLESRYLIGLLYLCFQKLQEGAVMVIETVNPLSLTSLSNFYIDPSHVKPVHPDALRFLLEAMGFRKIEVDFRSPLPDEQRLQTIPIVEDRGDPERLMAEIFNRNVEMLNQILYGPQDYAVIAKK